MNRYFIPGESRGDYPDRVYARVDKVEPVNREGADEVMIALDAVDANWPQFQADGLFNLERAEDNRQRIDAYWRTRFVGGGSDDGADMEAMFDRLPLYQIELTLPAYDPWSAQLAESADWYEIALGPSGKFEADVFDGLFSGSVPAYITDEPVQAEHAAALDLLFDMGQWPDATAVELRAVLDRGCRVEQLIVLDIGQGSAAALVCPCGKPHYYFDTGCGVYRNAWANPHPIEFCVCDDPTIILSHWDSDHWAGAFADRDLLRQTWVAPRQSIGPKHTAFAQAILAAGGRILIVPYAPFSLTWGSAQRFDLKRCTGWGSDRNGSGLALTVEDDASGRGWLLTGDAPYHLIPNPLPQDLAVVIVPHHGADMGPASLPPQRSAHPYSRLLYSFGPGNRHGRTHVQHPTAAAVAAHDNAGWPQGAWAVSPPPGHHVAGPPVLATAAHPNQHLGGAAAGWTGAPLNPGLHANCTKTMPVTQS